MDKEPENQVETNLADDHHSPSQLVLDNDLSSHPDDNEFMDDHHEELDHQEDLDHHEDEYDDHHHRPVERPKNCKLDMSTQYETPSDDWMPPEEFYETQITDIHFMKKKNKKKLPPTFDIYTQTDSASTEIVERKEDKETNELKSMQPEDTIDNDQVALINDKEKSNIDDEYDKIYSEMDSETQKSDVNGALIDKNQSNNEIDNTDKENRDENIDRPKNKLRNLMNFRRREYSKLIESESPIENEIAPTKMEAVEEEVPKKIKPKKGKDINRPPRKAKSQERQVVQSNIPTAMVKSKSVQRNLNKIYDNNGQINNNIGRNMKKRKSPPVRINTNDTSGSSSLESGSSGKINKSSTNSESTRTSYGSKMSPISTLPTLSSGLSDNFEKKRRNLTKKAKSPEKQNGLRRHNSLPPISTTKSKTYNKWTTNTSLWNPYEQPKPRYTVENRPPWRGWSSKTTFFVDPKYYL